MNESDRTNGIRYKISRVIIRTLLVIPALLCGCGLRDRTALMNESGSNGIVSEPFREDKQSDAHIDVVSDMEESDVIEDDESNTRDYQGSETGEREAEVPTDIIVEQTSADDSLEESGYGYSKLSEREKVAYKEILCILHDVASDVEVSDTNPDVIERAFDCVLLDHPEVFYVSGYSINKYVLKDEIKKIEFTGTYTMNSEEVLRARDVVNAYVNNCLAGAPSGDDYSRIKYVYEYIVKNTEYNMAAENGQNLYSVASTGRSVCQGYAKMMQMILNKMGIFCTLVNGDANDGSGTLTKHVWNLVKSDGKYYQVDVTWGDGSFIIIGDDDGQYTASDITYDYLLVNDEMISDTHRPEPVVEMPSCDSLDDNYYVREGLYLEEVTSEKLRQIFDMAYAQGMSSVTLKCADSTVYEALTDRLIDKKEIFDYLTTTSIKYVEHPERKYVMIYL